MTCTRLKAGSAVEIITPQYSQFLYGYPYVERMSTGVHDDLTSSALYLSDGKRQVLFLSDELIYLSKESVANIREGISVKTGIPSSNIFVATTHTHSGPLTLDIVMSRRDKVVPPVDHAYVKYVEENTVKAGCKAFENAQDAEIAFLTGDATGVGTNRHDINGPKDMQLPTMLVRNLQHEYIGCMLVCSMHPTALHEDSKLVTGDFPHFTRAKLQQDVLGAGCPVVYYTGTCGNQSPRHVTKANNFSEAQRLGEIVASSIISKIGEGVIFSDGLEIKAASECLALPKRKFPSLAAAQKHRDEAKALFETRKKSTTATPQEVRTAEVDWFGSEEALLLSELAEKGELDVVYDTCLPAEVMMVKVGDWKFVGWPGEVFVEFGLSLKSQVKDISLITYANGELQGYVVTQEAHEKGFYEAGNSFFDPEAGYLMLEATKRLVEKLS